MEELNNLWRATAAPWIASPALRHDTRADVVVIGAGMMGCAAARSLARAGASVIVLEAGTLGQGASSRPGGFVVPAFSVGTPEEVRARLGDAGDEMCRLVAGSAQRVFDIIAESAIMCDAKQGGWYHPAPSLRQAAQLADTAAQWWALGLAGELLDRDATQRRTGASGYEASWYAPSGGTLHPLLYTRGLFASATASGALCYENSPVLAIERQPGGHLVRTALGSARAERVLVCTNGDDEALIPAIARSIVHVDVWQCATAPIDPAARAHLLDNGACLSDMRQDLFTYRFDRDWRLITGALDMLGVSPGRLANRMARRLRRFLGLSTQPRVEFLWSGTAAVSAGRLPVTFAANDGVLSATACNGRGIAMSTVVGEALAARALDRPGSALPHFKPGNVGTASLQQRLARIYPHLAPLSDWIAARGTISRS